MFEKAIKIILSEPPELHYPSYYADLLRTKCSEIPNSSDLIGRRALCEYALNQKDKSVTPNDIMRFPSAQPETHEKRAETHACDLIDRQAAIDIERNATVDTNPSHFEAHQKFTQFMDDAEVSSFGRWQWSNGFNTALTAVRIDLKKLPSVQPSYTDVEIQKMQDLESAEIEKAYQLGYEEGKKDAQPDWNEMIVICDCCGHAIRVRRQ